MKRDVKKILITTPIFYVNSDPHLGNLHTVVLSDYYKRYYALLGYDVFLSTGTDEHGDKIARSAAKKNISTQEFVDINAKKFKDLFDVAGIDYNRFIRTTESEHENVVLQIWNYFVEKGYIYAGKYSGYYSYSEETFFAENELNQEKTLSPNGTAVEYISVDCDYLKLSHLREQLLNFYKSCPTFPANRTNELEAFISKELKDLCVSRGDTSFGISVPNSNRKIYVWFDALINYLTVSGFEIKDNKPTYNGYWSKVVHLVGKDIAIFHGVFWPAMLMLLGCLPEDFKLLVHNWWIIGENKMSKSLGNIIEPNALIEKYGVTCMRFYIIFKNLINTDCHFEENEIISLYNSYLVNKFSNLISRVFSILEKRNIKVTQEKMNEKYINILKNAESDINQYLKTFFEWCDDLNAKVDINRIWESEDKMVIEIAEEINALVKFIDPIAPQATVEFQKGNFKIFNRII